MFLAAAGGGGFGETEEEEAEDEALDNFASRLNGLLGAETNGTHVLYHVSYCYCSLIVVSIVICYYSFTCLFLVSNIILKSNCSRYYLLYLQKRTNKAIRVLYSGRYILWGNSHLLHSAKCKHIHYNTHLTVNTVLGPLNSQVDASQARDAFGTSNIRSNGEVDAAALENSISVDQLRELLDSDAEVLVYVDNAVDKAREDFKQQSSSGESKCYRAGLARFLLCSCVMDHYRVIVSA